MFHSRGAPRKLPTTSNLVAAMSLEEFRSFCQVPTDISLELLDGAVVSTLGLVDNSVYFTWEQFAVGLRFPISSLVKQCPSREPPTLIHLNVFIILMGCSMLNFLYLLDISLVGICFIYTLKLGIRGHLYMSAHSPQLQFVTGLPSSPKTKEKWVIFLKCPWYKKLGSLGLPFNLNQSLSFPGLSSAWRDLCFPRSSMFLTCYLFLNFCR